MCLRLPDFLFNITIASTTNTGPTMDDNWWLNCHHIPAPSLCYYQQATTGPGTTSLKRGNLYLDLLELVFWTSKFVFSIA